MFTMGYEVLEKSMRIIEQDAGQEVILYVND